MVDGHNIRETKWWVVNCMRLDVWDYMHGDMSKKDFIEYMRIDIKTLSELLDKEEKEKE